MPTTPDSLLHTVWLRKGLKAQSTLHEYTSHPDCPLQQLHRPYACIMAPDTESGQKRQEHSQHWTERGLVHSENYYFFNEKEYTVEWIDSVFSFCVVRREREGLVFSQRKQEQWIIFGRSSKVLQRFFGRSTERSADALRAERFKKVKTEKRLSLPLQWWDHKTIWK